MEKKIIILICFALTSITLRAQLDGQTALFPWASPYYNPGAVGMQNNTLCFTFMFLNQNSGFKPSENLSSQTGTDQTTGTEQQFQGIRDFLVNAEFYSRKIRGAIGLSVLSDDIGPMKNIGVRLGYTYRMKLGSGDFGVGFQANLVSQTFKSNEWLPGVEGDPIVDGLRVSPPSYLNMDFSLGLHYKAENWDVGASVVNLLGEKNPLKSEGVSLVLSGGPGLYLARHLYVHGGYIWTLPNPSWTIEPKAIIKTDFSTFQTDIMILTRYNGIIWTGLDYRIQDAVSVLIGARPFFNSSNNYLKGLDVGFAYGIDTKKFGYKSGGGSFGHFEVVLKYCFDIYKAETFFGYGSSRAIYRNQY